MAQLLIMILTELVLIMDRHYYVGESLGTVYKGSLRFDSSQAVYNIAQRKRSREALGFRLRQQVDFMAFMLQDFRVVGRHAKHCWRRNSGCMKGPQRVLEAP